MSVGRPRPDLIARCLPVPGSVDHPVFGLSTVDICTSTNIAQLDDGFKVCALWGAKAPTCADILFRASRLAIARVCHFSIVQAVLMEKAVSFAGLGFLSCYLAGKMHLWDRKGHRASTSPLC